ncbi:MAG: DUF2493 domain-containing protein [Clostridia bacterium]|nr:DUF2493 domain-containing protein [Clostridia bacterium]
MKVAVIGSRGSTIDNIADYLPQNCTEIVSGGAKGIDLCAAEYAKNNGLKLIEFKPEYSLYGKNAPLVRNREIVDYSDIVLAFWDGSSKGTKFVIDYCRKVGKNFTVILLKEDR